ncbi:MAG: hypothetical protein C4519_20400 [Desulfobacteraceae bacterium]|nr:MAG: hypothetical protein C4519_20400 [Desulfobacteraceae bacterium]
MGKDSLIKSTTKEAGKKKESKKKAAQSKTSGPEIPKGTRPQVKKNPSGSPKPPVRSAARDLLFKQFVSRRPPSSLPSPDFSTMTSPPLIVSDDPAEAARMRKLLLKHFDMTEIKAFPKAPIESKSVGGPESDAAVTKARAKSSPTQAQAPEADQIAPAAPIVPQVPAFQPEKEHAPAPMSDQIAPASPIEKDRTEPRPAQTEPSGPEEQAQAPASLGDQIAPATPIEKDRGEASGTGEEGQESSSPAADQIAPATPIAALRSGPDLEAASTHPPDSDGPSADPVLRAVKLGMAALALLIVLIIWASISNSFKYFLIPANGSIEIRRGDFSPAGQRTMVILHGVRPEAPVKPFYRRQEVYPMVFAYYLNKADALLEIEGLPDYQSIGDYLQRADRYALNSQMRQTVNIRRNKIRSLSLLYKADVEAGRGTAESLQSALQSLGQARQLTADPAQSALIEQKIARAKESLASLKAGAEAPAGPPKAQ